MVYEKRVRSLRGRIKGVDAPVPAPKRFVINS
jgi:hypothetical protein